MNKLRHVDWIAILTVIAAGGLDSLAHVLAEQFPGQSVDIIKIAADTALVCSIIIRVYNNPTPPKGPTSNG